MRSAEYIGSNIGEKSDHSLPVTYSILQPPTMMSTGKDTKDTTSSPRESMSPAPRSGAWYRKADVTKSPYDSGKAAARYTIPMANANGLTSIASSAMTSVLLLEPWMICSNLRAQSVSISASVQICPEQNATVIQHTWGSNLRAQPLNRSTQLLLKCMRLPDRVESKQTVSSTRQTWAPTSHL